MSRTTRIRTYSSVDGEFNLARSWDLAFVGPALDSRAQAASDLVQSLSRQSLLCRYDNANPRYLTIDGSVRSRKQIAQCFDSEAGSIVIEATTLDVVELLELLRSARDSGVLSLDLLYAEPVSYTREAVSIDTPWMREFSLSENSQFEGVPGFVTNLDEYSDDTRFVVFLGYEGQRLAQASEQVENLVNWPKTAVLGIPGYAPGWEMNSIANNIDILASMDKLQVEYCAAASVTGALEVLRRVHSHHSDGGRTVVAPLGTKPHSIAAALFLIEKCEFQETALIWDHPTRSPNSSTEVRRWHVYNVRFDG